MPVDIPPISDYAHWNEDAERVWYEENKYDMMYGDEYVEDVYDWVPEAYDFIDPEDCEHTDTSGAFDSETGHYIPTQCDACGIDLPVKD